MIDNMLDVPAFLQDAPAGSLQLTGVLGLAALVWGLYQLRGPGGRGDDARPRNADLTGHPASGNNLPQPPKQTQSSSTQAKACNTLHVRAVLREVRESFSLPMQVKASAPTSLAQAIQMQLAGVRQITISAPGVILDQWTPDQLQVQACASKDCSVVAVEPYTATPHTNFCLSVPLMRQHITAWPPMCRLSVICAPLLCHPSMCGWKKMLQLAGVIASLKIHSITTLLLLLLIAESVHQNDKN